MPSHARTWIGVLAGTALVASLGIAQAEASSAATEEPGSNLASQVVDAKSASTENDARAIAEQYGHDVIVDSETSSTMLVKALAAGGFSSESDVVPARVKQADAWVEEDTTLQQAPSDWVAPVAAAAPVEFSPGGTDELAKVEASDGTWLTESWPLGSLPAPRLDASTAIYPDVMPGVDLRLSATEVGMSEVLVVKTPQAAANTDLQSLQFTLQGGTTAVVPTTNTVTATTPGGTIVGSGTPLWWDSSTSTATSDSPGADEPQAVQVSATSHTVSLDIASVTSSPNIQYPVYIDPDWATNSAYLMADWYTDAAFPDQSYLDPPEDSVGTGVQDGVQYQSRAFFKFDTTNLRGKTINSSHMGLYQTYANSCDTSAVEAWRYDSTATGFTWASSPDAWAQKLDQIVSMDGSSCAAPGTVGWNVGAGAVYAAANNLTTMTIAIKAANEPSVYTRKHYQWNATLVTLYDTPPSQPSNLQFTLASSGGGKSCGTPTNPTILRIAPDAPVTFSATIADADLPGTAQNLHGVFYLNDMQTSTPVAVASYTSPNGASGSTFKWNYTPAASALKDGDLYKWYVVSSDGLLAGAHSIDCYFRDYFAPVSATATVTFPSATTATVGDAAPVAISVASADTRVVGFVYWTKASSPDPGGAPVGSLTTFDSNVSHACGPQTQTVLPDGTVWGYACRSGGTVMVPAIDTIMSMGVIPFDAAGNVGDGVSRSVGSGAFASNRLLTYRPSSTDPNASAHTWQTDSSNSAYDASMPLPGGFDDVNAVAPTQLIPGNGVTGTADATNFGSNPYVLTFNGVNGQTPTETAPFKLGAGTTAGSLSVSVWVKPTDTTGTYTALSQRGPNQPYAFTVQVNAGHPSVCIRSQVGGSTTRSCVVDSTHNLSTTSWTLVTGIWDRSNNQLRLVLNDKINSIAAQAFVDDSTDPGVAGPIVLGSDVDGAGKSSNTFHGELADPAVFPGVISGPQLKAIYQLATNL